MLRRFPSCVPWVAVIAAATASSALPCQEPPRESPLIFESPLDLLERFSVARIGRDDALRGEVPMDSPAHFAGGWHGPAASEEGGPYRWMGARAGVVELSLVEAGTLTVSLDVALPNDERFPPMLLYFRWNGESVSTAAVLRSGTQTLRLTIPADATRAGMNYLQLLPSYWVSADNFLADSHHEDISVKVSRISISRRSAISTAAESFLPAADVDGTVRQGVNTILSYFTRVLPEAQFQIEGEWLANAVSGGPIEALLVVRDSAGDANEVVLADFSVPNSPIVKTIDLNAHADRFVELSIVVRGKSSNDVQPALMWRTIELSGRDDARRPAPPTETTSPHRPNIILLVFDTLRADYTEPYGATNVRTPNFTRLSERSLVFEHAFASTSWTRPSIVTMFTAQNESRHGTLTIEDKMSGAIPYLPEILRLSGYETIGISMNGHISPQWGFARGFDAFHDMTERREQILETSDSPEDYVNAIWDQYVPAAREGSSAPFFLYLHEIDPHDPYTPRPPFDALYPSSYTGQPGIEGYNFNLVRAGLMRMQPQDIAHIETLYRGEVTFVDAVLGAIADRLERDGLTENTLLIVTSDHGEEFGEHGGIGHMATLYDEVIRVPLLWSWPGQIRFGREISSAGLVDLMPTLLGLLSLPYPATTNGRDLSPMLRREGPRWEYPLFAQLDTVRDRSRRAIVWAGWKLYEEDFGTARTVELFDTALDPGETTNLWISHREAGNALNQMLKWQRHRDGSKAEVPPEKIPLETFDPETAERLRNLGYIQ